MPLRDDNSSGDPTSLEPGIFPHLRQHTISGFENTHLSSVSSELNLSPGSTHSTNTLPSNTVRYRFGNELARGGTAAVYRAHDNNLDRDVAIKVLLIEHANRADIAERFLEEARILGRLPHPGIPPVHDVGTLEDGRPFIAMKLVRGRTLYHLFLEQCEDRVAKFLPIFEQICQAIAFAHSQGVIHRDLKPGNVMVGAFGEAQVMDWGLAKDLLGPRTDLTMGSALPAIPKHGFITQVGSLLGTPAYMPPEQARGDLSAVNRRADVFALGAILCEILTEKPPYLGNGPATTVAALNGDLAGAYDRLNQCGNHPELVAIARQCLAHEPGDRPSDAAAVAKTLADYRKGVTERLRLAEEERIASIARETEHNKRIRTQALLAVVVMCLLAMAGGLAWWVEHQNKNRQLERERENARNALVLEQANQSNIARDEAATRAAIAHMNEAEAMFKLGQWTNAINAVGRADAIINDSRTIGLKERIAILRDARELVKNLDAARDQRRKWVVNRYDVHQAVKLYRESFEKAGIFIESDTIAKSVSKIRNHLATQKIIEALDDWYSDDKENNNLNLCLAELDPNPTRKTIREAMNKNDVLLLRKLAKSVPASELTCNLCMEMIEFYPDDETRLDYLDSVWRQFPTDYFLALHIGNVYSKYLNTRRDAVQYTRAAVSANPNNAAAWNNHGYVLFSNGNYKAALLVYHKALEIDPEHSFAWSNLARTHFRLQQFSEARFAAEKSVFIDPDNMENHVLLAEILIDGKQMRSFDIAAYQLSKMINDPAIFNITHHDTIFRAGINLLQSAYQTEAEKCFRWLVQHHPENPEFLCCLGNTLINRGYYVEAKTFLENAAKKGVKNQPLLSNLEMMMKTTTRFIPAQERLEDILAAKNKPMFSYEWFEHIHILNRRQHFGKATLFLDNAANLSEGDQQFVHKIRRIQAGYAANAGIGFSLDVSVEKQSEYRRKALSILNEEADYYLQLETSQREVAKDWAKQALFQNDLSTIRHPFLIHWLPEDEKIAWQNVWRKIRQIED